LFDGYTRHDFRNLMVKLCKKAGLPKALAHPHVVKHSIAKHMIAKAGIENTRQWLGHTSIASTGAYIKCTDDEAFEAMKSAVMEAA
jgi:site-specific recombinase XerD